MSCYCCIFNFSILHRPWIVSVLAWNCIKNVFLPVLPKWSIQISCCFSKIVREKRTQNIWMHNYKYASLEHNIGPSKIEKWMLPILIVVLFSVLFCLFKFSFSANSNRFSFTTIIFTLRFVNAPINETIVKQLAITEWFNDLFV